MNHPDSRNRFLIESCDVRGQLVRLNQCWKDARARTQYPDKVQQVLGEAFAATALLAGTIKYDGKLTLQVRGSGDIHLLVVQITSDGRMRGLARWNREPADTALIKMFGADARMTISIEANQYSEPYQGIVPLEGDTLADAINHYFLVSEQLKTALYFAVSDNSVSGMLLQALPATEQQHNDDDGWPRAVALADTLTAEELQSNDVQTILHQLYHEEQVRLFALDSLQFKCSCSRQRTDSMLFGLGEQEVLDIVKEQGAVNINCEFCDAEYAYDAVDVAALFKGVQGEVDTTSVPH
jgi:molecular chaperone Hsp33